MNSDKNLRDLFSTWAYFKSTYKKELEGEHYRVLPTFGVFLYETHSAHGKHPHLRLILCDDVVSKYEDSCRAYAFKQTRQILSEMYAEDGVEPSGSRPECRLHEGRNQELYEFWWTYTGTPEEFLSKLNVDKIIPIWQRFLAESRSQD
jgi:hypothetical protein